MNRLMREYDPLSGMLFLKNLFLKNSNRDFTRKCRVLKDAAGIHFFTISFRLGMCRTRTIANIT